MNSWKRVYLLSWVLLLCHCELPLQRSPKQIGNYSTEELTVRGQDLRPCKDMKNICVTDSNDCVSSVSHRELVDISCRYLKHTNSFTCNWKYPHKFKGDIIKSFIFRKSKAIVHCPSIFSLTGKFNLTIAMKSPVNNMQMYSKPYNVDVYAVVQAPRPSVVSIRVEETSVNITWTSENQYNAKCRIRHRQRSTDRWEEAPEFSPEEHSLVITSGIGGLQPFRRYSLAVSCIGAFGQWSDWSVEVPATTRESVPTEPPCASYHVEPLDDSSGVKQLTLLWTALQSNSANGIILGYKIAYAPVDYPLLMKTVRTPDLKLTVMLDREEYDFTVLAYNSVGNSPVRHLKVNSRLPQNFPPVTSLWVSSKERSLWVQWRSKLKMPVPVSEFAIEWTPTDMPELPKWTRVNGSTFSTALKGIMLHYTYNIVVYPIYGAFCGPPRSIQANFDHGALLDVVKLKIATLHKNSVNVQWEWQKRGKKSNILQYRLMLKGGEETQSLIVFPDVSCHSFNSLRINQDYSVYIYAETMAGNFSKENIYFTTPLFERGQMMKAVIPMAVLIFMLGILSILTRTVCKEQFFPIIANPGYSVIGRWLLDPKYEGHGIKCVLKLEDFALPDQVTEKTQIEMEDVMSLVVKEYMEEISPSQTTMTSSCPMETSGYVDTPSPPTHTEYIDFPLIPANVDYVEKREMEFDPACSTALLNTQV